jgi:hypothetical protein
MIRFTRDQLGALRWAIAYAQPPHESKDGVRDKALRELLVLVMTPTEGLGEADVWLVPDEVLQELNPNGRAYR